MISRLNIPRRMVLLLLTTASLATPVRSETDFGQVSLYVASLLQDKHYARTPFDDAVSQRLLDNYLEFLDYNRVYFTQEDIDGFQKNYGTTLDDKIFTGSIQPAHDIYELYQVRVKDRVAKIKEALENGEFTFQTDRTIQATRKDLPWPANMEAADQLWHDMLEGELLQEQLRLEALEKMRAENTAASDAEVDGGIEAEAEPESPADTLEEPAKQVAKSEEEESPREKIIKRYERFMESLEQNEAEDVANYFLSALANAYDPHSEYFSYSEMESFETQMRNRLVGIGALLSMKDGEAEIQGIVVKGPADKSGLLAVGDRIIAVGEGKDGELQDITYMKLQKVVEMIRGEEDSIVRLKIVPADAEDGSQAKVISILREEVQLKDKLASAELIEMKAEDGAKRKIGWITVPSFYADMEGGSTSLTTDVNRLLQRLMKEGIEGLVVDLRGNGGGSLEEAIKMTGLFIESGPVVQAKNYRQKVETRASTNPNPVYEQPLVILTDQVSASASEIMAAALQDYGRAVIVGERSTFGKGTVQTIAEVANHMPFFADKERAGALKVTIQKFYRIDGTTTQLKGVIPDVIVPSVRDALDMSEASLKNPLKDDTIRKLTYDTVAPALPTSELDELSEQRIKESNDFQYIVEDTERLKAQMERNTISLNIEQRRAENERNRERTKARNKERVERYASITEAEGDAINIYRLTLDNVDDEVLHLQAEFTDEDNTGMRMAKSEDEELAEEEPEYPFGLDPIEDETLNVMTDLIAKLTSGPSTASVIGGEKGKGAN